MAEYNGSFLVWGPHTKKEPFYSAIVIINCLLHNALLSLPTLFIVNYFYSFTHLSSLILYRTIHRVVSDFQCSVPWTLKFQTPIGSDWQNKSNRKHENWEGKSLLEKLTSMYTFMYTLYWFDYSCTRKIILQHFCVWEIKSMMLNWYHKMSTFF